MRKKPLILVVDDEEHFLETMQLRREDLLDKTENPSVVSEKMREALARSA